MNDHPPERVDPLLCVERGAAAGRSFKWFYEEKSNDFIREYKDSKRPGLEYGKRVCRTGILRYEENDVVYEVTYDEFATQCRGVAAWLREQGRGSGPQGKSRINGKQQSPLPGIFIRRYGQRKCSGSL